MAPLHGAGALEHGGRRRGSPTRRAPSGGSGQLAGGALGRARSVAPASWRPGRVRLPLTPPPRCRPPAAAAAAAAVAGVHAPRVEMEEKEAPPPSTPPSTPPVDVRCTAERPTRGARSETTEPRRIWRQGAGGAGRRGGRHGSGRLPSRAAVAVAGASSPSCSGARGSPRPAAVAGRRRGPDRHSGGRAPRQAPMRPCPRAAARRARHTDGVLARLRPDGQWLATASLDRTVRLWSVFASATSCTGTRA